VSNSGDITIDVSSAPYETGFKFNTVPFGGMTIDAGNAVRLSSPTALILATSGSSLPTPSAELRGGLFFLREAVGSGNADSLHVCRKKADDSGYEWKAVTP
jgi:hypothetical protein